MTDTPETERLDFAAGARSAETIRAGLVETITMIDATLDAQRAQWNRTRPLHDDPSITFEAAMFPDGTPAGSAMISARATALLGLATLANPAQQLVDVATEIATLHQVNAEGYCTGCESSPWPCPTLRAVGRLL